MWSGGRAVNQAGMAAELTSDAVLYSLAASLAFLVFVLVLDPKLWRTPIGRSLILLDGGDGRVVAHPDHDQGPAEEKEKWPWPHP